MAPLISLFKFTAYKSDFMTNTRTVDIRDVLNYYLHISNPYGLVHPFTEVLFQYREYWMYYLNNIPNLLKFKKYNAMLYDSIKRMLDALRVTLLTLPEEIDFDYFKDFVDFVKTIVNAITYQSRWIIKFVPRLSLHPHSHPHPYVQPNLHYKL